MRFHRLVVFLVLAILTQSCWAVGEWLHTHGEHDATLSAAALNADGHDDGLHGHDRTQPSESERDHHHSCFAHSPFALSLYSVSVAVTTEAFTHTTPLHQRPDAPSTDIERPNWRSPA